MLGLLHLHDEATPDVPPIEDVYGDRVDIHGDPLPFGAIARLGSVRFRVGQSGSGLAALPDGKHFVAGLSDQRIGLFDLETGQRVRAYRGHRRWSRDPLSRWSLREWSPVDALSPSQGRPSPEIWNWHRLLGLWPADDGRSVLSLSTRLLRTRLSDGAETEYGIDAQHLDGEYAVRRGKNILLSGGLFADIGAPGPQSQHVLLLNSATGALRVGAQTPNVPLWSAKAVSWDGRVIAYTIEEPGRDRTWVRCVEIDSGKAVASFAVDVPEVRWLGFASDGTLWLIAEKAQVERWTQAGELIARFDLPGRVIFTGNAAVSEGGHRVVIGADHREVYALHVFDAVSGRIERIVELDDIGSVHVSLLQDGSQALVRELCGRVRVVPLDGSPVPEPALEHRVPLEAVRWEDDQTVVGEGTLGHTIVWNVETSLADPVRSEDVEIEFADNSKSATSAPARMTVTLQSGAMGAVVVKGNSAGSGLEWSTEFEPWDGNFEAQLNGFTEALRLTMNPVVSHGFLFGSPTTGILFDTRDGRELARIRGHLGAITAAAFSPDGTRLATGGADGVILIWDVEQLLRGQ